MKNNILKSIFLFIGIGVSLTTEARIAVTPSMSFAETKTVVLCIGTIHSQHASNPNYTYSDIYRILETFSPDAICLEIPPSYFRSKPYLKEMTLGAIYGLRRGIEVYPIDWWGKNNPRAERAKYIKTNDYKVKREKLDSLYLSDSLMCRFEKIYGTKDDILNKNNMGYLFFNGKEYNAYIKNMYMGLIEVFGDGCMNLYSEQRNARMTELIKDAIDKHQGKRVIILTGAEHKYYFDEMLSAEESIELKQLTDFLPLGSNEMEKDIAEYLETGLSDDYYTDKEIMYWSALTPLLHGPDMDDNPSLITTENLKKAEIVIKKWKAYTKKSVLLDFNQAWYYFLSKKYKDAIAVSSRLERHIKDIPLELQNFVVPFFWRNLGFCYDMEGNRKQATESYLKGIEYCKGKEKADKMIEYIFKNYVDSPYKLN